MPARRKPSRARILREAARFLDKRGRRAAEANLRADLAILFDALDIGSVESEYPVDGGRADLYLPNQRTFIEAKASGKARNPDAAPAGASESPLQQLDRYVLGEIGREMRWGHQERAGSTRGWTGVLTDGVSWHVRRYPHEAGARPRSVGETRIEKGDARALADLIEELLGERIGKPWIPANPSALLEKHKRAIDELYGKRPARAMARIETKRRLWFDMIKASGMAPKGAEAQERLFVAHSFLVAVVRLVRATRDRRARPLDAVRDGFASWLLDLARGERWVNELWESVSRHDWVRRRSDVIREIYEDFVAERDRNLFGEFYTPDWLAEMMVREVLDDKWLERSIEAAKTAADEGAALDGRGVLDPACGSGTFLYHAASRLAEAPAMSGLTPRERADVAARLVNGIDIHPIAVEMAKANLVRALPAMPTGGESALRIFVGDSLQAAANGEGDMFARADGHMLLRTPRTREIMVPMRFVRGPAFPDRMRRLVAAAAEGKGLPRALRRACPGPELAECHRQLSEAIEIEGNSVWTWYAINMAGPHLLAERKVDRIVANPPWVKLAEIQVRDRKRMMESLGETLGLQVGGKQAPHLDIASLFILRARELYMVRRKRTPAVWLVKKAALRAGNWEAFRTLRENVVVQTVDLERLAPFGGGDARRSCLLMEHRKLRAADRSGAPSLAAGVRPGAKKPAPVERWPEVKRRIAFAEAPAPFPRSPSAYAAPGRRFRQGATVTPGVLLTADRVRPAGPGLSRVETRRSSHHPWNTVPPQTGDVPEAWVTPLLHSGGLLPFVADSGTRWGIVPVDGAGRLHPDPAGECAFWRELDEIYETEGGLGKGTPKTLMGQIDHLGKASMQLPLPGKGAGDSAGGTMVLHPASGDIMRAARVRPGAGLVDAGLYWRVFDSESEAGYLTAVLNAPCLRRAFFDSRGSGRHFNLDPWRNVPVPAFDRSRAAHKRLAALCGKAEALAARALEESRGSGRNLGQQGLSRLIRDRLSESDVGREIDAVCRRLLPRHADRDGR